MNIKEQAHQLYMATHVDTPWEIAQFRDIYNLTNDTRGKFGEQLFSQILHYLNWDIQMDISDQNVHDDGHYDMKANQYRFEVKTSCLSTNNMWQHEPLYAANVCDYVVFFDFSYNEFYITLVKNKELPLNKDSKQLFGRKHGTLRKNKDDGYKLDFSNTTLTTLTKEHRCAKFTADASIEELAQWFNEVYNNVQHT